MTSLLDTVVQQLHVLVLLGIAAFIWYIGWRRYRLDLFRQRVFSLRDELFDIAADGNIPFGDHAYSGLRRHLNNMIRFGHRLNSSQVVALTLFAGEIPKEVDDPYRKWRESVDLIEDVEVRKRILNIHERLVYEMVAKIAFTSVLMLLTLGLGLCVLMLLMGATGVVKVVARLADKLPALSKLEEEFELAA
jgi:hypothetical protein